MEISVTITWRHVVWTAVLLLVALGLYSCSELLSALDEETLETLRSTSPDGMYRCSVKLTHDGQARTYITLHGRCPSPRQQWQVVAEELVEDDSACRSNYSIDWQYDDRHRTTGVTVFGDFGTPPYPGEIIFSHSVPAPSTQASP